MNMSEIRGRNAFGIADGIAALVSLIRKAFVWEQITRRCWMTEGVLRAYRRRREHDQGYYRIFSGFHIRDYFLCATMEIKIKEN